MASPKLTVIIATYNMSNVLRCSTASVLDQTFADFELLVVGDGCTDDSEQIVTSIGDPRVRWINLPVNSGHQTGPNNEGLRQARGELIAYLGHDDLWLPNHLDLHVAAIEAGADLTYGITRMVQDARFVDVFVEPDFRPGKWLPPSCFVHRRSVTGAVGGWRDYRAVGKDPEIELLARIHDAGYRIAFIPRLTAIKFPAANRRNVYRDRPSHEQAAWLERMRNERDLEGKEVARLLASAMILRLSKRLLVRALVRQTLGTVRKWLHDPFRLRERRSLSIDFHRRFKGLPPISAPAPDMAPVTAPGKIGLGDPDD